MTQVAGPYKMQIYLTCSIKPWVCSSTHDSTPLEPLLRGKNTTNALTSVYLLFKTVSGFQSELSSEWCLSVCLSACLWFICRKSCFINYVLLFIYLFISSFISWITRRTTQLIWEECWPCPVFASYTLAFALLLSKEHGKTSVRVAEECQLVRWKKNIQNIHNNKNTQT
jgi:hypothetical protein